MQSSSQRQIAHHLALRDVSSTARLFNFNCPVFMTEMVWQDCVTLDGRDRSTDELAVLQRLRHVLFMASSVVQGGMRNTECEFKIHRVPNSSVVRHPEPRSLILLAHNDINNQPVITIKLPDE